MTPGSEEIAAALQVAIKSCEWAGDEYPVEEDKQKAAAAVLRAHLSRLREEEARVAEIKADSRYNAPPAIYQINGPLALIQVAMKAEVETYERLVPKG